MNSAKTRRPKVLGVVQARLGSTRLANKMLLHLRGYAVIEWVFRRVKRCRSLDLCVFALPEGERDEPLAEFLTRLGAVVRRGPETDVLKRFCLIAEEFEPEEVVRICADNPLVSWEAVDSLVQEHLRSAADYTYNHVPRENRWPDGFGAEICSFACFRRIEEQATLPEHREHLFNYLWTRKELFKVRTFDPADQTWWRPEVKLDLDTWRDYRRLAASEIWPEMTVAEVLARFGG
jgi:spore coat polysaccharide biosynthesis protein SpsF